MAGHIYYLAHDVTAPSGGVNVLYEHVAILREAGLPASILHREPGFQYPYARHTAPVEYLGAGHALKPDDWLVVPEDHAPAIHAAKNVACNKVIFCQGHYNLVHGITPGEHWRDFGFAHFLCVSEVSRKALSDWFGVDAVVIPPAIERRADAAPMATRTGPISVAFMPRKGVPTLTLLNVLLQSAQRAGKRKLPSIAWRAIDRMTPGEVRATMAASDIFLATGQWEGFGLPPIEAMAEGCVVIGYRAGGGAEYASDDNGVWVPDESPFELTQALCDVVETLAVDREAPRFVALRQRAVATADAFSASRTRAAILDFWHARAGAPATAR